jgi:uncharacterized protein YraI
MHTKVLLSVLVLFSLLAACNMPMGQTPSTQPPEIERVSSDVEVIGTAVELTAAARLTEIAGSAIPTSALEPTLTFTPAVTAVPTQCNPLVTATVNANLRSGPDTAYDVVGSLTLGQTAAIVGRNDAYTWWYIDHPGTSGGHAWIAGSVVTSSCVPAVVQVVAAPPLPTVGPVADNSSAGDSENDDNGNDLLIVPDLELHLVLVPDLVVTSMVITPNPATQNSPISVQVKVKNQGTAPSGNFSVQWWASWAVTACNWSVSSLAAGDSKDLSCSYTYQGWNNGYAIKAVVDAGGLVAESNEDNNSLADTLKVNDAP